MAETLELLKTRLERIEFLVTGKLDQQSQRLQRFAKLDECVTAQLSDLERELRDLAYNVPVVRNLLDLYQSHSTLFQRSNAVPEELSTAEVRATVLASAPLFPSTVSSLQTISDTQIPSPSLSTNLIDIQPRLDIALVRAEGMSRDVSALRARTAKLLERWMEVMVLTGGECWVEWDERLRVAERTIRRSEARRTLDEA